MNVELAPVRATDAPLPTRSEGFWVSYGLATFIYLVAAALTRPVFIGDTMYYLRTANPGFPEFWDFGHLFWRPLLSVLLRHLSAAADPSARFLSAFHILDFLSTVGGMVALWFAVATLRLFRRRMVATAVSATLLSCSQAVLTHSKGGCAYIFGFLAVSVGFYALLSAAKADRTAWYRAAIAGGFLALAVCLWFPYVLAAPGALLAPLLFSEQPKKQWRLVLAAAMICAVLGLIAYGAVAIHLGIRDFHGFVAWAGASSHSITTSGAKRVVFGFARSFMSLGEDGIVFKRFLFHDPYNPVHIWQVFGLTWKIILFYIFLASVLRTLVRSPLCRGALLQLLITALPVLGFAGAWQGTDLERYLPLFPALMLAIGLGLSNVRLPSAAAGLTAIFVIVLVAANLYAFSAGTREQRLQELTATVRSLSETLPPESLVLLPPLHPLERIYWDFPEALPLAERRLKLEWLVELGADETPQWRTRVCGQMSRRWNKQSQVVIGSSLLQTSPEANSSWVEGDDPRVRWRDINDFTAKLELGSRVGNTEFFLIPATARNVETIGDCEGSEKGQGNSHDLARKLGSLAALGISARGSGFSLP